MGYQRDGYNRISHGISYTLDREASSGHCYLDEATLTALTGKLLGLPANIIRDFFPELENEEYIIRFMDIETKLPSIACKRLYDVEESIAKNVVRLMYGTRNVSINADKEIKRILKKAKKAKVEYDEGQIEAIRAAFLNQFGESRDPYEYEVERLHQYVEVCNYSVEEIKMAMDKIVKELPGPSFNAIGHYVEKRREAGNADEKRICLEDAGYAKDADEERIEDSSFNEKIAEILDEKIPSLWDSNKLVIDDINGFLREDAKATNLELIVGSGKTFMVPFIAAAGNKQGLRFVYCTLFRVR